MLVGFFCAAACIVGPGQLAVDPSGLVHRSGRVIGQYVDDTDQAQTEDVAAAVADGGLTLAGIAPGYPARRFPGAISLYEYYPVGYPWPPELPKAQGYVLQGTFCWTHGVCANYRERRRMWCRALRFRPRAVLWYSWGPRVFAQTQRIMAKPCR